MSSITAAQLYHLRTAGITDDLPALSRLIGDSTRILEVGCGTGRVLNWLAAHHPRLERLVGVEMDREKAELATSQLAEFSHVAIATSDFLNFETEGGFDVVLFAFNVVTEFLTGEKRQAALAKARELIESSGRVVIAVTAPNFEDWAVPEKVHRRTLRDESLGETEVVITCHRDRIEQVSRCEVEYVASTGELVKDRYEVALLTRRKLLMEYAAAQLNLIEEYGSYELTEITPTSPQIIHVLTR